MRASTFLHRWVRTEAKSARVEKNPILGISSFSAHRWVHPMKKSERTATGGEGWDWNHWITVSSSLLRDAMMGTLPEFPTSLTFSTPDGRSGWGGKGRTKVSMKSGWWAERSGPKIGRFLGVTKIVILRPLRASWWVRSSRGSKWPWAGYGNTRMWTVAVQVAPPFVEVAAAEVIVVSLALWGESYKCWRWGWCK
uniref:Uncharacterized protein n=1 Tax=Opuntia streptacantha TaxID=393608 RepID=A0A7C9D6Z4_OPUST